MWDVGRVKEGGDGGWKSADLEHWRGKEEINLGTGCSDLQTKVFGRGGFTIFRMNHLAGKKKRRLRSLLVCACPRCSGGIHVQTGDHAATARVMMRSRRRPSGFDGHCAARTSCRNDINCRQD